MEVRAFDPADAEAWDAFCDASYMSTLLHTRRFLSYHGSRFEDASLIFTENGAWMGVLPAARDPNDPLAAVSHPGATYGGIVHAGELRGEKMLAALQLAKDFYAGAGYRRVLYKALPRIYHRSPAEDDLYALFRIGAQRIRCDLSCAVDLRSRLPLSQRRRRSLKKAHAAGVRVEEGLGCCTALWEVLSDNLQRKHGATPVHTLAEIQLLQERFPDEIFFIAGMVEGVVEGGVVLFETAAVSHAQYIAASQRGYDASVLDAVFDYCLERATRMGKSYFDFGISNELQGQVLNEGLYRFKSEFGGGGIVHEFYEIRLNGE